VPPDAFRAAMRRVPAAVAVVTTELDGVRYGLTATAVTSVSAAPPQVLVCVHGSTRTAAAIEARGRFGVSYLRPDHVALAEAFAAPAADHADRFARGRWTTTSGAPLLEDALGAFGCTVVEQVRSGTHLVVVGEVTTLHSTEGSGLLYARGAFAS
jgi:flavin reductase (DIM6/NTAB) family NADH-FMN oxidoreductase RutF